MNFLKKPNLPENRVIAVACDCRLSDDIRNELTHLGVKIINVSCESMLPIPISSHPDIHICHLGGDGFITSNEYCENFTNQVESIIGDCYLFNNLSLAERLSHEYPKDVLLNCATVGDFMICNTATISKEVLERTNKRIINVKQGYTKCSTCVVSDSAIITDDMSIKTTAEKYLDVLYVDHGQVELNGYNYGFIGGCSGKLSKDVLAFAGNIALSKDYNNILDFCKNHGVYCISLAKHRLYDYGSILPIIEQ